MDWSRRGRLSMQLCPWMGEKLQMYVYAIMVILSLNFNQHLFPSLGPCASLKKIFFFCYLPGLVGCLFEEEIFFFFLPALVGLGPMNLTCGKERQHMWKEEARMSMGSIHRQPHDNPYRNCLLIEQPLIVMIWLIWSFTWIMWHVWGPSYPTWITPWKVYGHLMRDYK